MGNEQQELELDFRDVLKILGKYWKFIVGTSVAVSAVYFAYSMTLPKQYESYTLLRIGYDGSSQLEQIIEIREIMKAQPTLKMIAEKASVENYSSLGGTLEYEDVSGLLRISGRAESPAKAAKIVQAAIDIIIDRHSKMHETAQDNLATAVKFIKDVIRPVPLSSGINEFKSAPTVALFPPVIDDSPVKPKNRLRTSSVFLIVIILTTLLSFYLERRKTNKK